MIILFLEFAQFDKKYNFISINWHPAFICIELQPNLNIYIFLQIKHVYYTILAIMSCVAIKTHYLVTVTQTKSQHGHDVYIVVNNYTALASGNFKANDTTRYTRKLYCKPKKYIGVDISVIGIADIQLCIVKRIAG